VLWRGIGPGGGTAGEVGRDDEPRPRSARVAPSGSMTAASHGETLAVVVPEQSAFGGDRDEGNRGVEALRGPSCRAGTGPRSPGSSPAGPAEHVRPGVRVGNGEIDPARRIERQALAGLP
jgi:hypothetical protein